jgi:aspartate-semialdehyde dehydrogenase
MALAGGIKTVAVAGGTGGLGQLIVEALKQHPEKIKVIVLSRKQQPGCTCICFDKEETIESALKGVDYVVCALATMATGEEQKKLMKAARKCNVKYFFPSEFGADTSLSVNSIPVLQTKVGQLADL